MGPRHFFSRRRAHRARATTGLWSDLPHLLVRLDLKPATVDDNGLSGEVIAFDGPFGNLVTNISAEDFFKLGYQRGDKLKVTIAGQRSRNAFRQKPSADVPLKEPLLYIDSREPSQLRPQSASFAAEYKIDPPQPIFIPRKAH